MGDIREIGDLVAGAFAHPDQAGQGEYLALLSAGAYGFVMASNYNTRSLAAEVLAVG